MVDIIRFSFPLFIIIPIATFYTIGKYIGDNYDIYQELFKNEESFIYNKYYQCGLLLLFLLLIYFLSSFFLSGFIIWSYKPELTYPYENISNRGERITFPENTIEAIRRALNGGAQVILIDIQLTKDKKAILLRNEDLSKINSNFSGKVKDLNYSELPKLFLTDKQKELIENENISEKELKIPLLEDVLKEFSNIPFILNLVSDSNELADIINEYIKENDREHITIWGSFNHERISRYLYNLNKKIPLFFSKSRIIRIVFYDFIGILPFLNINESVFISTQQRKCVQGFSLLRHRINVHMNNRGIPVFVYSDVNSIMNDADLLENLRKLRINGIISDDSALLTKCLNTAIEFKEKETLSSKTKNNN